jgi:UDP-N-acetylglucosamine acyltransferase
MSKIYQPSFIHPTAVIGPKVTIEDNVYIGPLCIIGFPAEWKGHEHEDAGVIIKSGTRITGLVTIDSGVGEPTYIGRDCYLMKHVHIGHNGTLGDRVTMAPGSVVGGHSIIGADTNIGISASVHQKVHVGYGNMIGMGAVVTKKTELSNNKKYVGIPARIIGDNNREDKPESEADEWNRLNLKPKDHG